MEIVLGTLIFLFIMCVYAMLRTTYIGNLSSEMIEYVYSREDWEQLNRRFNFDKTYSLLNVLSLTKWSKKDLFPEFKDILDD